MEDKRIFDAKSFWLLMAALLLMLIGAGIMLVKYYFIVPDSVYLLGLGKNMVTGHGLTINDGPHFRYPPAYGFISGLLYLLIGNIETAGHIISMLSGALAIFIVYVVTARVYNRTTGLIAAGIIAINPLWCWISSAAAAEGFYALWYATFLLIVMYLIRKPSMWMSFLLGFICSLAYLTRAEGFLLMPLAFITLLIAWWRGRHEFGMILTSLFVFIIGWLLLSFPYLLFLRENLGYWSLSGKIVQNIERVSEAIFIGDYESLRDNPLTDYESEGLLPYLVHNFPRVAERYIHFTWQALWEAITKAGPVLLLFLYYIYLALRDGTKRGWHFLWFASPLLVYPLAHIENRYVTPTLVTLVPLLAWGLYRSLQSLKNKDRTLKVRKWLAILLVPALLAGQIMYILRIPEPPTEERELAFWMRDNVEGIMDERISARFPYVSFYMENEDFLYLPKADTLDEIFDLAIEREIDYMVISERLTAEVRPALEPLTDPDLTPAELELVHEINLPGTPEHILLYRINRE